MIKTNARIKIKNCETALLWLLLAVILILTVIYFKVGIFYTAFLIGYCAGTFGFIALSITFSYIDKLPGWFKIIAIMGSSFKILIFFILAFILHKLGFSIVELIAGLLFSQLTIIGSLVIIIYTSRKSVENSMGKEKLNDARP